MQACHAAAPAQAEAPPAATSFDFGSYAKQQAHLVNQALDRLVPLQHPESITEPMRCAPSADSCSATPLCLAPSVA